jgi:hypothetical protein
MSVSTKGLPENCKAMLLQLCHAWVGRAKRTASFWLWQSNSLTFSSPRIKICLYQQNLTKLNIVVLVLCAPTNRLVDLKPLVPKILSALPTVKIGQVLNIGA